MKTLVAVVLVLSSSFRALAADVPTRPDPIKTVDSFVPTFAFTGYFWAAGLNGRTSTFPPLPATDLDMTFGDVLKDLNGGIMGAAEMRIGRWEFIADTMFSQVTTGATLPGPYFSSAKVRSQSVTLQASAVYRIYSDETFDVDIGAGVRYWNLDNRLKILPGALNLRIDVSESENWLDPILIARLHARLGGPWSLTLAGDVGGFDAGSKLTWQAVGTVNYQWNEKLTLKAGYRALYVDYAKGNFLYDVTQHGPVIAATYRF